MNILGFNPGHHGSVCLLQDGELTYFIQEERVTRKKYTPYPLKSFLNILQNYKIDYLTFTTPSGIFPAVFFKEGNPINEVENNNYYYILASLFSPDVKFIDFSFYHHFSHCSHAFYNSGFKKALGVVIDGLGSEIGNIGQETETIFECSYPINFKILYKNIFSHNPSNKISYNNNFDFSKNITPNLNLSRVYESITMHLGWDINEAGKTMGLAPYGKFNKNFPLFFNNKNGNPNTFFPNPQQNNSFINEEKNPQLKLQRNPKEWHYDESKITDLEKDLAWRVQNDTQQIVGDYIEEYTNKTGLKQVCCAGGYFLNCVTNYYLTKRFPDIEFYFEPIANDAGTAIGAAKLVWHRQTQDTTIRSFKSLYLGKQYSKDKLLEGIKKYT